MGRNQSPRQRSIQRKAATGAATVLLVAVAAACGSSGSLNLGAASTTTTGSSTPAHSSTTPQSVSTTTTTIAPTTSTVASTTIPAPSTTTTRPPATTTTVVATTAPPTTATALPTVDTDPVAAGYTPAVRPSTIYLSGDSTNVVYGLRWAGWDGRGATGYGTVNILSCVPNCAQGSAMPTPVTVYLNNPVGGAFSLLTEIIQGMPAQNFTVPTS